MADCEVCGHEDAGYVCIIEGAKLKVCGRCARMGKIISSPAAEAQAARHQAYLEERKTHTPAAINVEQEIAPDYAARIQRKLNELGLTPAVLAERINERESYIHHILQGKARPEEKIAHKIEKELGITLLSTPALGEEARLPPAKGKEITLGDVLEIEKKKKK